MEFAESQSAGVESEEQAGANPIVDDNKGDKAQSVAHVLIAGAGPGGLSAAMRLQQLGIRVTVIEKRSRENLCADVGGFYELSGNVIKTLEEMGLRAQYEQVSERVRQFQFFKEDGTPVRLWPLPDDFHMSAVRRSDIQRMFVAALGEEHLLCGSGVQEAQTTEDGVELTLENGTVVKGDVLIGADGIHSRVLQHVFPEQKSEPTFQQCVCYWGFFDKQEGDRVDPGATVSIKGKGKLFGLGSSEKGLSVWAGFLKVLGPADQYIQKDPELIRQEALEAFGTMQLPWIRDIINRTNDDGIIKTLIFDRDPLASWHKGRVVLMGDAAHPMTPFVGQGANMAMIDGFLLATLLSSVLSSENLSSKTPAEISGQLKGVFEKFQDLRKEPAQQNVLKGRQASDFVMAEGAFKGWIYNTMMKLMPLKWMAKMTQSADRQNDAALVACGLTPVVPV